MNNLKCPKLLSHCLTELFPIYQNKHWTIRRQDNCSVDLLSHHIILKIVRFQYTIFHVLQASTYFWVANPLCRQFLPPRKQYYRIYLHKLHIQIYHSVLYFLCIKTCLNPHLRIKKKSLMTVFNQNDTERKRYCHLFVKMMI